jgi:adenylate cyclase
MDDRPAVKQTPKPMRDRTPASPLIRRTFAIALLLTSTGLVASGAGELYLRYRESVNSFWILQSEMAQSVAFKIEQFMQEIERTMNAATLSEDILSAGLTNAYQFQLYKLLKVAPAITSVSALDAAGREQLKVSRVQMIGPGDLKDRADDEAFRIAKEGKSYFGPVYFVQESEPYARLAIPIKRIAGEVVGVLIAEVNLKYVWNVVSKIRAGQSGYAYVISKQADLIAHPDISLVLKRRNLGDLEQVRAAIAGRSGPFGAQTNFADQKIFAAYAAIPSLDWIVIVERPAAEAYELLYASLLRTGALLLLGLSMAVLASFMIGLRVVRPLRRLREGAALIGAGALDHQIDIGTGDELEGLADEFNQMTIKLRESYKNIEHMSHLKRYFSPQIAELIISSEEKELTESHRQEITVLFCDLRNFTAFSSVAEPDEVIRVLREYYEVLEAQLLEHEATIGHFAGDGLMAFFNDPLPCPDPTERAVRMSIAMQHDVGKLIETWHNRGIELGFGIGISSGRATLGHIGSEKQFHYTAIGPVVNLASRLCDQAKSGQTLITEIVAAEIGELAKVKKIGELALKGFPEPILVSNVGA